VNPGVKRKTSQLILSGLYQEIPEQALIPAVFAGLHQSENLGVFHHFARIADFQFAGHHGHHGVQVFGEEFLERFS
jgi:hypothetical protein